MGNVRKALTPASTKVIKGHLVDIVSKDGKATLQIRNLDGKTYVEKEIPAGSFIVNCTDHLSDSMAKWEPVISEDQLVLAPQWLIGFSGPSAAYATHMFFLDKLEKIWRDLPRLHMELTDKPKLGISLGISAFLVSALIISSMPGKYALALSPRGKVIPFHRVIPAIIRLKSDQSRILKQLQRTIPERFTDYCSGEVERHAVIGGNLGASAKDQDNVEVVTSPLT